MTSRFSKAIRIIHYPMRLLRKSARLPYWLVGKYVQLRGNTFGVEGYRFSLTGLSLPTYRIGKWVLNYEVHERAMIKQHLDRSLPVIEFGGGLGVISCLTNKLLIQPKNHVVVEANPEEIFVMRINRQRLDGHFEVIEGALGYGGDTITFRRTPGWLNSSTKRQDGESIEVNTVTLGSLIDRFGFQQVTVICDVEGTEVDLVAQEIEILARHVKLLIVELHPHLVGSEAVDNALQRLASAGFTNLEYTTSDKHATRVGVFENNQLPA